MPRIFFGGAQDSCQKLVQKLPQKLVQKLAQMLAQWGGPGFLPRIFYVMVIERKKSWAVFWTMQFAGAIASPHKSCARRNQNTFPPDLPSPLPFPSPPTSLPPSLFPSTSSKPTPASDASSHRACPFPPHPSCFIFSFHFFSEANLSPEANPLPEPTSPRANPSEPQVTGTHKVPEGATNAHSRREKHKDALRVRFVFLICDWICASSLLVNWCFKFHTGRPS